MEIIYGKEFTIDKPVAVTIGKYESIHLGHQILLQHTEHYRKKGYSPLVFTFDVHPGTRIDNKDDIQLIYSTQEKERILSNYNIDYMIEYPFDEELISMSPYQFFKEILIKRLNAKAVIVGEDFKFGHNRSGDVAALELFGDEYNVQIDVVGKQCIGEHKISSSKIREVVSEGNMELAAEMLGRPFSITGEVVHGKKLGRTIGMPTINIVPDKNKLIPPRGVYSSRVKVKGNSFFAVANIGYKPTVDGTETLGLEAFIFQFDQDIYGETVTVELLHFQRAEIRFDNIDALKEQMDSDKKEAYRVLER